MPSGSGSSLGAALVDLFGKYTRPGGARASYHARGWHAQLSQLTGTQAGRQALDDAGLSVTGRTLRGWLATTQEPTRGNRDRIAAAYRWMAGGFDRRHLTNVVYAISGVVKLGRDVRDRGSGGTSPLRVDGSNGIWDEIEHLWGLPGTPGPTSIEARFIVDVLINDLGEGSDRWEFPGTFYTVNI